MPDHEAIYAGHADMYERLVSVEDYEGNIRPAIEAIRPLAGLDVVEVGAGTGRLTRLLAPHVHTIRAYDASAHMLETARTTLAPLGLTNWELGVADHRALPAESGSADLIVGGWTVCYLVDWSRGNPRADLDQAFTEMRRVLRPGGTIILLETMGTGHETPTPPPHLADYYRYLADQGFESTWIRTDYRFASPEDAEEVARFFFGDELADRIRAERLTVLPECTGLWWKSSGVSDPE